MNVQSQLQMDNATFLHWVQEQEGRYELAGGRVVMITGGTMRHGLIVGNLFDLLRRSLDRKQWAVLTEFGIDAGPGLVRYADVVVDRAGGHGDRLTAAAPVLIAEVLSPTTAKTDLGDKAVEYLRLEGLSAYLTFAQDEIKAWTFNREGALSGPGPNMSVGAEAVISIPTLGVDLPLAAIYAGVEF